MYLLVIKQSYQSSEFIIFLKKRLAGALSYHLRKGSKPSLTIEKNNLGNGEEH